MNRRAFLWLGSIGAAVVTMGRIGRDAPLVHPEQEVFFDVGWNTYPKVFASAGEVVTCESGHSICTFAETVNIGQYQLPHHLGEWRQEEPKIGTFPMPVCAKCGSKFVLDNGHFHFHGGWR